MNSEKKLAMIKLACVDWAENKLSEAQALMIITMIISTVQPSPTDLMWAEEMVKRYEQQAK